MNPEIKVTKYVSPDNGVSWLEAPDAPGPFVSSNVKPQFKFVITNPGDTTFTNVMLVDDVFGIISLPSTTLNPGQTITVTITRPWHEGAHQNTATVTGIANDQEFSSSSTLHYTGIKVALEIIKYVSVDNGLTWQDANTAPGPLLPSGNIPKFKYVVSNVGIGIIGNITVEDNVLGLIGTIDELVPGQSEEFIYPNP